MIDGHYVGQNLFELDNASSVAMLLPQHKTLVCIMVLNLYFGARNGAYHNKPYLTS